MLDDRDRRVCQQIEDRLAADDPAFASRMRAAGPPRLSPAALALCAIWYIVTPILALLAGRTAALVWLAVFFIAMPVVLRRTRQS
jgi:hypothetical protein